MLSTAAKNFLNYGLFPFFDSHVKATKNSQISFSGNFIRNKNIEIFFNESAIRWIKIYKERMTDNAREIYQLKQYNLDFEKYLVMFYFYLWVLKDFQQIGNFIEPKSKKILNIGAGIGFLDILLANALNPLGYCLVELDKLSGQTEIDGQKNKFSEIIFPYQLLKKNISSYNLENLFFSTPDKLVREMQFDLVISIRSWGFLYPINFYIEYLSLVTNKSTLFIADIHQKYLKELENFFHVKKIINHYKFHDRILFSLK